MAIIRGLLLSLAAAAAFFSMTPTTLLGQDTFLVAFASDRNGDLEIYVINADGSGIANLTNNLAAEQSPAWSSDGDHISFQSFRDGNGEIYVMDADGSGQTNLTNSPGSTSTWSPDGTKIAFDAYRPPGSSGSHDVYVMSADGTNQVNITNTAANHEARNPAWSPDGTRIAFDYNPGGGQTHDIYLVNPDGTNLTRLTTDPERDQFPAWSPDGTKIAFASYRDGNYEIYVMDADGANQVRLTNSPGFDGDPAWSPDATKIAFQSARDGNNEIYVLNADGSGIANNLTNNLASDSGPAWTSGPAVPNNPPTADAGADQGTGNMIDERFTHTSTLLQDGRVLIATGRQIPPFASIVTAEIYDPSTRTFSPTGSLATARTEPTATLLNDGRVLIAGGRTGAYGDFLSSAELYDPASGAFSPTGNMADVRTIFTATLLPNGKVLVVGGIRSVSEIPDSTVASAELYDPSSGTFDFTGSMVDPDGRHHHSATLLQNGKVLIVGGGNENSTLASAELYDPSKGTFTSTGSMAVARKAHTATLLPDGRVLVSGGLIGATSNPGLASAELYDPETETFTATGSMSTPRHQATANLLANGTVLIAGGWAGGSGDYHASAEIYDPSFGSFALSASSMKDPRYAARSTQLQNGEVLITGGFNDGSTNDSADVYDPTAGSFTNVTIGDTVQLDGSGSSDPDGDTLSYSWIIVTQPAGSSAALSDSSLANPTFIADEAGTYVLELVVNDGAVDSNPDQVRIFVSGADTSPPETIITSAVDGNGVAVGNAGSTSSSSITFAFTGTDNIGVAGFECSLDAAAFSPCGSPTSFNGLTVGNRNFQVRAFDVSGNRDLSPATLSWLIADITPPETIIVSAVDHKGDPVEDGGSTRSNSITFEFTGTDNFGVEGFECSLDGLPFDICASPQTFTQVGSGSHTFDVRAIDTSDNRDPSPDKFSWSKGTPTLGTIAGTVADSITGAVISGAIVTADTGQSISTDNNGDYSLSGVPTGGRALTASAPGYLGQIQQTTVLNGETVVLDFALEPDSPPNTTITSAVDGNGVAVRNGGSTDSDSISFSFTGTDNAEVAGFECSLDAAPFSSCASPTSFTSLAASIHAFQVRALDGSGTPDPTPESFAWTVNADVTSPETTITSAVDGNGVPVGNGGFTGSNSIVFEFTGTDNIGVAGFECSLDAAPFTACVSPTSFNGLTAASHAFQVRAVDNSGNKAITPASFSWTVNADVTSPETTITSAVDGNGDAVVEGGLTGSDLITFAFTGSDDNGVAGFECKLDTAEFAPCSSPVSFNGLMADGHTFKVRAVDTSDNVDLSPAAVGWTVDLTLPETAINALDGKGDAVVDGGITSSDSITFTFTGSDNVGVASFECSLDPAAFSPCSSPIFFSGLASVSHTFQVRSIDTSGNVDLSPAVLNWTVDLTPPDTAITSAVDGELDPVVNGGFTGSDSITFAFTGSDDNGVVDFECSLDGAVFSPCSSPISLNGLAGVSHTFQVRSIDPSGNVDLSPAGLNWTVDLTPPDTSIIFAIDGDGVTVTNGESTGSNSISFAFTGADENGVSGFECSLDDPDPSQFAPCSSPKIYTQLGPVEHTFRVRAIDIAGNPDEMPAIFIWTFEDTTPPDTTIVSAVDRKGVTVEDEGSTRSNSITFEFTGFDANGVAGFECKLDDSPFAECASPLTLSPIGSGLHTFYARAIDTSGKRDDSPASFTWTKGTAN